MVSYVSAGILTQTAGPSAMASPVVAWSSPAPDVTRTAQAPAALLDDAEHALRVAPRLDAVEPKTTEIPVQAPILMPFSQWMNHTTAQASFLIPPAAEARLL